MSLSSGRTIAGCNSVEQILYPSLVRSGSTTYDMKSWFAMLLRANVQHASARGTEIYRPTKFTCMHVFVRIIEGIVCGMIASRRLPFL